MSESRYFLVTGRVQGVGFRAATQQEALRAGLTGWVRNLISGQVELQASGAASQLDRLQEWLHQGPRAANVTHVLSRPCADAEVVEGFTIRY